PRWVKRSTRGRIRPLPHGLEQRGSLESLGACDLYCTVGAAPVERLERASRLCIADLKIADILQRYRGVMTTQSPRQYRTNCDGTQRRSTPGPIHDCPVDPAIVCCFDPGRAGFHIVLRVEMRARRIGRASGMSDREVARLEERQHRREGGMQSEEAIQVQGALVARRGGRRNGDCGPQLVVPLFAVRNRDIEPIGSAPQKYGDQRLLAPRRSIRTGNCAGQPARQRCGARNQERRVTNKYSASWHNSPLIDAETPASPASSRPLTTNAARGFAPFPRSTLSESRLNRRRP